MKFKFASLFWWLLIFVPIAMVAKIAGLSSVLVFTTACLGMLPLAGLIGNATEYLAQRLGAGYGALLNATFGNACELVISIAALNAGLPDVVKASITGSIIGNILLVLGASMLFGGLRWRKQKFHRVAVTTSVTLLVLVAIAFSIPLMFHYRSGIVLNETRLAIAVSIVLVITYVALLIFSLKTHRQLYVSSQEAQVAQSTINWNAKTAILTLLIATIAVAILSECLVEAIDSVATHWHVSRTFIGVVLVAIIGNAAEHSTAVFMALKNKMDLSVHIALGSATQIGLFVTPVLVFASFLLAKPMNLVFSEMEIMAIVVSVLILALVATDGESNWLEGVELLAVYLVIAAMFFFV